MSVSLLFLKRSDSAPVMSCAGCHSELWHHGGTYLYEGTSMALARGKQHVNEMKWQEDM